MVRRRNTWIRWHIFCIVFALVDPHQMSSTQQGISGINRWGNNGSRPRRTWSGLEEEFLISAIRELIAQGFKSDNEFRAGYLGRLEDAMRIEFPTTDMKGNPHINSKISSSNNTYYSLSGIMSRSGVGFNTRGTFMIDVEDDTWDSIVKVDPSARTMRYKQWPYYDVWKGIFGWDHANGDDVEDLLDAYRDITPESNSQQASGGANFGQAGEQIPVEDDIETSISQSFRAAVSTSSREKMCKLSRDIHKVCAVLDRIACSADACLEKLSCKVWIRIRARSEEERNF